MKQDLYLSKKRIHKLYRNIKTREVARNIKKEKPEK